VQGQQPLWAQIVRVERVLSAVRQGQGITQTLQQLPDNERPGVQAIAYAVLRRLGLVEKLLGLLVQRKPTRTTAQYIEIGLALLAPAPDQAQGQGDASADARNIVYEAHTVVNQVVQAIRQHPQLQAQAGFVNACLRRFQRETDGLMTQALKDTTAKWNHPSWWVDRLKRDYPDQWREILEAGTQKAGMSLRVNRRQGNVEQYLQQLKLAGLTGQQIGQDAIRLTQAVPVSLLPAFSSGAVSVQDAGAQYAAELLLKDWPLARQPSRRPLILDACAAPGGKTAHLLECLDAEMIAIDMDEERTLRIHNTLTRLGLKATVLTADAGAPETWAKPILGERQFDAILLDAPCSASGIVRRHPDIPWQRRESDIQTLGAQQARLLTRLWPLLRPEGRLLFCTCSVFKEEGQDRLKAFLSRMQDAHLIGKAVQLLPTSSTCPTEAVWTHGHAPLDHDGFFYALLEKRT
jgi:16S rRNA (cytosine967-C5)-methyltransferase